MKSILYPFVAVCITCAAYAASPAHLDGKRIVANYTHASFSVIDDGNVSPWIPYAQVRNNSTVRGFFSGPLTPKATRNLLPLTRPGQRGKYTYRKTGEDTGEVRITEYAPDGVEREGGRLYKLTFTSPTSGFATEEVYDGSVTGYVHGISFTVAKE